MDNDAFTGETSNGDVAKTNSVAGEKALEASGSGDAALDNISVTMSMDAKEPATKPYAGMGKEDLLRFSQTPFWNRMRMGCVVLFWIIWICLLTAVVVLTIVVPRCTAPRDKDWWETTVFYQVYVRSFYDSINEDGVGDIRGMIEKLDHFEYLNVDAVILSSIYESHTSEADRDGQSDFGYDVVNHKAIDPVLGTMEDFEELVEKMHEKDMKLLIDFIPNHTGDKHPWFADSESDQTTKTDKWNYYVWEECGNGSDTSNYPTNWLSIYGQDAWNYSHTAGKCYLHQFFNWQPELNLRSSQVKEELDDILEFWLEKNVDGFRVNSVKYLFEDNDLRDEDRYPGCSAENEYDCYDHKYTTSQSEIYPMVDRWRRILERYSDETDQYRILLTDAEDTVNHTMRYYGDGGTNGAHLPINYQLTYLRPDMGGLGVETLVDWWIYNQPEGTSADWLTGYQDQHRIGQWMGDSHVNIALMLQLTLPGTAITYYGEELGMMDGNLTYDQDPAGDINEAWTRDPYRTPMQWSDEDYAGFTNVTAADENYEPWIPPHPDYTIRNVEAQRDVYYSPMRIYRRLCEMHRDEEGLHHGHMHYAIVDQNVFSFIREYEGYDSFLIAANFGTEEGTFDFNRAHYLVPSKGEVVFRTAEEMDFKEEDNKDLKKVFLRPGEGAIFSWPYSR